MELRSNSFSTGSSTEIVDNKFWKFAYYANFEGFDEMDEMFA